MGKQAGRVDISSFSLEAKPLNAEGGMGCLAMRMPGRQRLMEHETRFKPLFHIGR
jgi:hypothetical protein